MTQHIVVDGDTIPTTLNVAGATITLSSSTALKGTGQATIEGKTICLAKDVGEQDFTGTYDRGIYKIGGTAKITIKALQAKYVLSDTAVMVSDGNVEIDFEITNPAVSESEPPTEDLGPGGQGTVSLSMANNFVTAASD